MQTELWDINPKLCDSNSELQDIKENIWDINSTFHNINKELQVIKSEWQNTNSELLNKLIIVGYKLRIMRQTRNYEI